MSREFEMKPAVRESVPLLCGLFGPSGSGKTFSGLRLATGIQRVAGGDIGVIDTESRRALHYADKFKFKHVELRSPFGSLDYLEAIAYVAKQGCKVIMIDSMSHEHEGPGGYLETHETELTRLVRGDDSRRGAMNFLAWAKPAADRQRLINSILQINANFVFAFRAKEKLKIEKGKDPLAMGWMPIAGDSYVYEMTVCALLYPACKGVPIWNPTMPGEKQMLKLPEQFLGLIDDNKQLSEDHGQKLAQWAKGDIKTPEVPLEELIAAGEAKAGLGADALKTWWEGLTQPQRVKLKSNLAGFKETAAKVTPA